MLAEYRHIAAALRKASSVVIGSHVKPDGDAIGSMLGLTLALQSLGIAAVPALADDAPPPFTYSFLPGFALCVPAATLAPPEVFVALDTPNPERLGMAADLFAKADLRIVCDHHPDNTRFGDLNVVDPEAAASGQMVWRIIEALNLTPTPDVALCCWVALATDTGRFSYSNTTPDALRDGAAMVEAGANVAEAHRLVYENRSMASLRLEARVVSRLSIHHGGRVAYSWITDGDYAETGAQPAETEHLVDTLRALGGVDVAILLRVHPDHVRVNLRSKTDFDVSAVARRFGGGGHVPAAGFTFDGPVDALLPPLLDALPGGGSI
ncbi:MAG: bifunctional oligoribonuclease/PAP phosphatase NrnA [Clostridiales bacterium]|nr:bifunctional oligoribonuclease/PAP phosphatase NrnA [Clostridiales bacterium]